MLEFLKMHGIGNDYVYIDTLDRDVKDLPSLAVRVSERHFGVGSDGLIVIGASEKADFRMDIYNADGSRAEMCGNGVRCAGKYVYDKGLTGKSRLSFDTLAGIKYLDLTVVDGKVSLVTVDMGQPELEPEKIPVKAQGRQFVRVDVETSFGRFDAICVSMGNPHAVIFGGDPDHIDVAAIGREIENSPLFPKRTNVEFAQVIDGGHLKMRVWERGSGETLACGTGACATVVAAVLTGQADRDAEVSLRGGQLLIKWDENDGRVYMTGPAETVFEGKLFDDRL